MQIPILSENDYKIYEIKLVYTKEEKQVQGIHEKYLEEKGWYFNGSENLKDNGMLMVYTKQKLIGQAVFQDRQ